MVISDDLGISPPPLLSHYIMRSQSCDDDGDDIDDDDDDDEWDQSTTIIIPLHHEIPIPIFFAQQIITKYMKINQLQKCLPCLPCLSPFASPIVQEPSKNASLCCTCGLI